MHYIDQSIDHCVSYAFQLCCMCKGHKKSDKQMPLSLERMDDEILTVVGFRDFGAWK